MPVFIRPSDYSIYTAILARQAERYALEVWAYCLMPNHVHVIAVPSTPDGLARPFGEAHRRYALQTNRREGWAGHLWQDRFRSFVMNEAHLHAAIRYVLLNPVRAGLVHSATDWPHSSARAHVLGHRDLLITPTPVATRIENWDEYLRLPDPEEEDRFRRHIASGRPLGSDEFVANLENEIGRSARRQKPGPKGRERSRPLARGLAASGGRTPDGSNN